MNNDNNLKVNHSRYLADNKGNDLKTVKNVFNQIIFINLILQVNLGGR